MMSSSGTDERDDASAHAQYFATHGFADVGTGVSHAHGTTLPGHTTPTSFGRAPHGSVRALLLWALAEKPMHGYQIMSELEQASGGFWKLSSGSVYPKLQQLADEDLVTADAEGGRRVYTLTDEGRVLAQAIRDSHGPEPWAAAKGVGERRFRLWRALSDVAEATRRLALEGTEDQSTEAENLLEQAGAQLGVLLNGEAGEPS
jgi:DNA-binding PadR family transcriptional regulator